MESRFDFRNVEASFELNDASKTIKVLSESDFQVNQLLDIWCRTVGYLTLQVLCFASKMKGEEKMPSFDIVSEVDLQEARNAVDNASREVESRFDFRNVEASFELNDASKTIKVLSESDFQVNQLLDILRAKLLKRGIEGSSLDVPENIVHSGKTWFVEAKLKQGIESATQKKIVKMIKD